MKSIYQELPIEDIQLDHENPRIKMYLEMYDGKVTAEGVALALNNSSENGTSFSSLKESIRVNKSIINPILVNHTDDGKYTVIEGNTRVQIYRDFKKGNPDGPWNKIPSLVYDNLSEEEKHAIRLQAHLVGPRDWDPYSKAKYLYQLSCKEYLPIETIISYCGGKRTEINQLIDTYKTMLDYYIPMVQEQGYDIDFREFSKFAEAQRSTVQKALLYNKFGNKDFADWVINGKIDNAQSVRQLPQVLQDANARKEFLKSGGKLTDAIKFIAKTTKSDIDLSNVPYEELAAALISQLRNIKYTEVRSLQKAENNVYTEKRELLLSLYQELSELVQDFQED